MNCLSCKYLNIFILLVFVLAGAGCKNEKEIISYSQKSNSFTVVGFGRSAPSFIGGITLAGYLKIPSILFKSNQLDGFMVFGLENGTIAFITKDTDGKYFLIAPFFDEPQKHLESYNDLSKINIESKVLTSFEFSVLNEDILLKGLECIIFRWHSGGIKFYSYKNIKDGALAFFQRKYSLKADKEKSGYIRFTKWHSANDDWPKIKSIDLDIIPNN